MSRDTRLANKEIEIRSLYIGSIDEVRHRLMAEGLRGFPQIKQIDMIFDRIDGSLFRSGQKIRIRLEGDKAELTYKGDLTKRTDISDRVEINVTIDTTEVAQMAELLEAIGYPMLFQVPKTRETFKGKGLAITIDTWPIIGVVIELEGPERTILSFAEKVFPKLVFKNYRLKELFEETEKRIGVSTSEMIKQYEYRNGQKLGRIDLLMA